MVKTTSKHEESSQENDGKEESRRSRRALLSGLGAAAVGLPLGIAAFSSDPVTAFALPARAPSFYLSQNGIYDDGVTDYTDAINTLYQAAAKHNGTVVWDVTKGQGYKIAGTNNLGVQVPANVRTIGIGCNMLRKLGNMDHAANSLQGAYLFPAHTSLAALMTVNGNGATIQGLGFWGLTASAPNGSKVPGLVGVKINSANDVAIVDCIASDMDDLGTGGAFYWNGSSNGRCYRCHAYHCSFGVKADGSNAIDGQIDGLQVNAAVYAVMLGASGASNGGDNWALGPGCHMSGGSKTKSQLWCGPNITSTRCMGVYFDTSSGPQILHEGRGLVVDNSFFLGPGSYYGYTCAIALTNTSSNSPDATIIGNRTWHSNLQGLVIVGTSGKPYSLICMGNTASGNGKKVSSWKGFVLNKSGSVLTGSTRGTSDFATNNQVAW
jgi:hypothetical protein